MKVLLFGMVLMLAASLSFAQQQCPGTTSTMEFATITGSGTMPIQTSSTPAMMGAGPTTEMTTSPEVDAYNRNLIINQYGISGADIMYLRAQGFSWGDVNFMANMAVKTGRPIREIAALRSQGMSWSDITMKYNVSMADINQSYMPTVQTTGVTIPYGTLMVPPFYRTDKLGNPILTFREARSLERLGYDWRSIAIAANISAKTAIPFSDVLRMTEQGLTWPQIAVNFGLRPQDVLDISGYPYATDIGSNRMSRQYASIADRYGVQPSYGAGVGAGGGMRSTTVSPWYTMPPGYVRPSPVPSTTTPNY